MCKDYLGIDIKVGDVVVFPAGKDMMDGVVEKIRARHKSFEVYVKNAAGYKKWKDNNVVINRSVIEDSAPQLFV